MYGSGTAIFLKLWSKGNFSYEEVTELEKLFRDYLIGFIQVIQDYVSEFQINVNAVLGSRELLIEFFLPPDLGYYPP